MGESLRRAMQEIDLGADDEPIQLPVEVVNQAVAEIGSSSWADQRYHFGRISVLLCLRCREIVVKPSSSMVVLWTDVGFSLSFRMRILSRWCTQRSMGFCRPNACSSMLDSPDESPDAELHSVLDPNSRHSSPIHEPGGHRTHWERDGDVNGCGLQC